MKNLILLLVTIVTLHINGQSSVYRPFPTTSGNWIYEIYGDQGAPTFQSYQYTLSGDTIVSNSNYKKIFYNSVYRGALRELSKIIYFIPDTSSIEYVLYNFNLKVGDTIFNPFGGSVCSNDTIIIQYEDSILVSDGYHRQLHLPYVTWIEGIGSTVYLLEPAQFYCVSGFDRLRCMSNDASFSYPSSSPCVLTAPSIQNSSHNDISIFPNPSNGSFTLDFANVHITEIIITDLLGNIVFRELTNKQTNIKIDNLNLHKGTYFLTAIDVFGGSTRKKIISCP